jgi:DNA repair protein RecO (recombination protein O)
MPLVATDALVLHVFDYLETSRIFRLATRDYGVQSVLARGVRRSSGRFGSALDLFSEGVAQLDMRPGRELQTLTGFDVVKSRPGLATDLARFTAAASLSECVQRVVTEDHAPVAFDIASAAFDALCVVPSSAVVPSALGALWRLVSELGFTPSLDACAACHQPIDADVAASFSHAAGGVLCGVCARRAPGARRLPLDARRAIEAWVDGREGPALSEADGKAHQRLLREFLGQHLTDVRTMKAWTAWEQGRWSSPPV